MKEIEQVSIGGYAFTLEKDAADILSQYLKELEAHYMAQESGKEIMEGIEERVAELLLDKVGSAGVVNQSHIQMIIDIIGRPERIEADDPGPENPSSSAKKKLFRDLENKRLGGVCSGLAAYFDTDVAWIRAIVTVMALVLFFSGKYTGTWSLAIPVFYCILWVAMPAARSPQDRWAMKGDNGTLDDIRRNVATGIHEMENTAREVGKSDFFQRFGRLFLVIIGLALLITGTSGLASTTVLSLKGMDLFGAHVTNWLQELSQQVPGIYDLISTPWVVVIASLAVILPFVGMLYGGIQLIFGFKSPSWRPGLVIFVLWLIDLVVLLVLCFAGAISADAIPLQV